MAFFALEIAVNSKRVILLESPTEDQACTDWKAKGKEVWTRVMEEEVYTIDEITQEQFEKDHIPEGFK